MKKTEQSTLKQKLVNSGANSDYDYKIVGLDDKGAVLNRRNMSVRGKDGNDYASTDIGGDELKYSNNYSDYDCICSFELKDYLIEVWCNKNGTTASTPVRITFNGVVMVETEKLPYDIDHPLQFDINESCATGEFYLTDFNENTMFPPIIFNLGDIVDAYNAGLQTYFTDFNPLLYQVTLNIAPHHPIFIELYPSGGGGGLPVGKYNYAIRYSDTSGNKTSWSVQTPNIPVMSGSYMAAPQQFPGLKVYGGATSPSATSWGIHIRFRVQNTAGYEFIEIRRVANNHGQALNYVETPQYKKLVYDINGATVDITNTPFQIIDWVDDATSTDWADLSDEEDTQEIEGSFIAKAVRYYQNRLVFMNIIKSSKVIKDEDLDDLFLFKENVLGFPVIEKLTYNGDYMGHSNIKNNVYYPHLQLGEKYGWGVYFQDAFGTRSFVVPYEDILQPLVSGHSLRNFQMPNRRTPLTQYPQTLKYSQTEWKGTCYCSDINKNNNRTFEVYDLVDAIAKTDYCSWVNIMKKDSGSVDIDQQSKFVHYGILGLHDDLDEHCDIDVPTSTNTLGVTVVTCADIISGKGTTLMRPTSKTDTAVFASGVQATHNYAINDYVYDYYGAKPTGGWSDPETENEYVYEPKGFRPNWFSTGMGFWGLNKSKIPSWAKSFSIVRTKPAGRVVCQGIGFWSLSTYKPQGSVWDVAEKKVDKLWFYSPDTDTNIGMGISLSEICNNAADYEIQLVSPIGGFTEIYSNDFNDDSNPHSSVAKKQYSDKVDMITYCRILREDSSINPSYGVSDCGKIGGNGYVSYGRWLNNEMQGYNQAGVWANGSPGEQIFGLTSATQLITNGDRGIAKYAELELTSAPTDNNGIGAATGSIYSYAGITHSFKFAYNPKGWCEPFYIVNIIRRGVDVPYGNNTTSFIETGHLQKTESLVGIVSAPESSTQTQKYLLVDERWEDCCVNDLLPTLPTDLRALSNRYCWVNENRWLNIKYKDSATLTGILTDLQNNGVCHINDIDFYGNPIIYDIYGVYSNDGNPSGTTDIELKFEWFNPNYDVRYFIPINDDEIWVKYDERVPIRVFAGDSYLGEVNTCFWDGKTENKTANRYGDDNLFMCTGIPYQGYHINSRVFQANRANTLINHIQLYNYAMPEAIRQLMVNFICESKVNLPFIYELNESPLERQFGQTHYIYRPHQWNDSHEGDSDPTDFLSDNNIQTEYYDNYHKDDVIEWTSNGWNYGGFKFFGKANIDYSKLLNDRINTSKPVFGFKEVTRFCSRIIWSEPRQINVQDDPNLKSYPAGNYFDISDAYEEIKYAYDNDSSKGNNLYAITGKGICLILTDKTILSDKTSDQIAMLSPETGFIQGEYWLTKDIGCNDQMWRGIAEYNNDIFIPNRRGVFMVDGIEVKDISANYSKELLPYLQYSSSNYLNKMYGVYNKYYNEYWLGFDTVRTVSTVENNRIKTYPAKTFMFCNEPNKLFWAGYSDYFYDQAAFMTKLGGLIVNKVYGSKDFKTYETGMDNGFINGSPYDRSVTISVTPQLTQTCELIDITCNSNIKPTDYYYNYKPNAPVICNTDGSVIRDYTNNFYAMCPRRSDNGNRLQNDSFVIDIVYNGADKFEVVSVECGFKPIKW